MCDCGSCGVTPFELPVGPTGPQGIQGIQGPAGPAGESITGPQGPAGVNANPTVNKYTFVTVGATHLISIDLDDMTLFNNENLGSYLQTTDYVISVKRNLYDPNNLSVNLWDEITHLAAIQVSAATNIMSITVPGVPSGYAAAGYRVTIIG
jgi:hypothetical protein